ncbi:hypothetical protein ABGT15_12145 [Flavobacterium enshiense]|uniref:hypothetical protein n=1 Tax=Flavobacterium enshiense TaxID=1341165 RepID=UPI00345C9E0D
MKKPGTIFLMSFAFLFMLFLWLMGSLQKGSFLTNDNVNTLFTGFGIFGLLITIIIQQKQILSNEEDIKKQKEINLIQLFENGFFILFNNYRDARSNIHHDNLMRKVNLTSRVDTFTYDSIGRVTADGPNFFDKLEGCFDNVNFFQVFNFQGGYNVFHFAFDPIKKSMEAYHSSLFLLIDYILQSELKREKKLYYLNFIFGQSWGYENRWLYIYSIYKKDSALFEMFKKFPEIRIKGMVNEDYEYFFNS